MSKQKNNKQEDVKTEETQSLEKQLGIDSKPEEIEDLEKQLGVQLKDCIKDADFGGEVLPEEDNDCNSKVSFSGIARQNLISYYENKFPEAIDKAKETILKGTENGNFMIRLKDEKIAMYFAVKYGWRQQYKVIVIC